MAEVHPHGWLVCEPRKVDIVRGSFGIGMISRSHPSRSVNRSGSLWLLVVLVVKPSSKSKTRPLSLVGKVPAPGVLV
jgi:hypothetical protein